MITMYCKYCTSKVEKVDEDTEWVICSTCTRRLVMGYKMKNGQWWDVKKKYPSHVRRKL